MSDTVLYFPLYFPPYFSFFFPLFFSFFFPLFSPFHFYLFIFSFFGMRKFPLLASPNTLIEPEISEAFSVEHPYPTRISVATCHPYALAASTPLSDSLYHDSGANRHIFHSRSSFTSYKEIKPLVCKGFESSICATAIGVGDVTIRANYDNASTKVVLKNCLHIPNARQNLISQLELDNIGIGSKFLGDGGMHSVQLIYNGKVIATGQGNTDVPLYKINMFVVQSPVSLLARVEPIPLANRISPLPAIKPTERRDFS